MLSFFSRHINTHQCYPWHWIDRMWLAVGSMTSVSSYLGTVSWMCLYSRTKRASRIPLLAIFHLFYMNLCCNRYIEVIWTGCRYPNQDWLNFNQKYHQQWDNSNHFKLDDIVFECCVLYCLIDLLWFSDLFQRTRYQFQ